MGRIGILLVTSNIIWGCKNESNFIRFCDNAAIVLIASAQITLGNLRQTKTPSKSTTSVGGIRAPELHMMKSVDRKPTQEKQITASRKEVTLYLLIRSGVMSHKICTSNQFTFHSQIFYHLNTSLKGNNCLCQDAWLTTKCFHTLCAKSILGNTSVHYCSGLPLWSTYEVESTIKITLYTVLFRNS